MRIDGERERERVSEWVKEDGEHELGERETKRKTGRERENF